MRRLVVMSLAVAVTGLVGAGPASATCMEHVNKFGVEYGTCSAPGGPPGSYLCVRDNCVWL